jgi:hypothetical protein
MNIPRATSIFRGAEPPFVLRAGEPSLTYGFGPVSKAIGGVQRLHHYSGGGFGLFPSQWLWQTDINLNSAATTQHLSSSLPAYTSAPSNVLAQIQPLSMSPTGVPSGIRI